MKVTSLLNFKNNLRRSPPASGGTEQEILVNIALGGQKMGKQPHVVVFEDDAR